MFIVFDGLDGTGKSTQVSILSKKLENVKLIKCPGRTGPIGQLIDKYLKKEIVIENPKAVQLLFSADRWQQQNQIKNWLKNDQIVICDRYVYSGIAASLSMGIDTKWAWQLETGLIKPDIIFYFDKPIVNKNEEIFETDTFQKKFKHNFSTIISSMNDIVYHIHTDKTIDETGDLILNLYKTHINDISSHHFDPKLEDMNVS